MQLAVIAYRVDIGAIADQKPGDIEMTVPSGNVRVAPTSQDAPSSCVPDC